MKQFTFLLLLLWGFQSFAQINYTAMDQVPTYDKQFLVGINPGWNGNNWTDKQLADISIGNPNLNVEGIGMETFRVPLPEAFLEFWGYEILLPAFEHYEALGMTDLTVFLQNPKFEHRDTTVYCPGFPSEMFANLYLPIWDDGTDGTPVNDSNYAALYFYKTVTLYKDNVRFWEIWNEPDFGGANCGWKPEGMDGNWFDNTPGPCETQLKTPVYHYIRLLKVAYEVIKSLDEDAFISVGGIGFESYLDVLLRFTDNPVDGSVTAEYPLKGGAYFDALSFHSYPHFNGTLLYFDSLTATYLPQRHSDAAVDGIIDHQSRFQAVLDKHGFDGVTFPKKEVIITETGMPSKKFNEWIGSHEAQKNFVMKVQIAAFKNKIRQIDFYNLSNQAQYNDASGWLDVMGMFEEIRNIMPYNITHNPSGLGCRTLGELIGSAIYDSTQTAMLNLPAEVNGAAFDMGNGSHRYVLWAKTDVDESEIASYDYTFPDEISLGGANVMEWDFSTTDSVTEIFSSTITLSGSPKFIDQFFFVNTEEPSVIKNVNVLPNPFQESFNLQFNLEENSDLIIELYDAQGQLVKSLLQNNLNSGNHNVNIESNELSTGVYFGKMIIDGDILKTFKALKVK